jgi:hypothetical protein
LLHFDHANISFGLVILKRNIRAFQEKQGGLLMFAQSIQQVAGGMLFGSATFALWGGEGWMHLISFIHQS